ncbi:MAG: hypothetical protein ACI9XR_002234 [Flavobacterium sp.]|jgi:uncharacterized protein (TIGR02453 family)
MITKNMIQFLADLTANNNKEWMHANKKRYEEYKKEYHNFIGSVLIEMKQLDPNLSDLEIKNCTFRINRDIRFSKDKQPYKTNIALWFTTNKTRKNAAGYYLHFQPNKSFVAGGLYNPENEDLKKIRKEIEFFYADLEVILDDKDFKSNYGELTIEEKNKLKRAPKGFDENHKAIEFLKLKSFTASMNIGDKEFLNEGFPKFIATKMILLKPLIDFVNRGVETEE